MPCNIFTYGSLMFSSVWQQVVRGHYRSVNARLSDHARFAVAGESYPGLVAQRGAAVEGVLYLGIDAPDIARLDGFEGSEYRRAAVHVLTPDGADVAAHAYLYNFPQRLLDAAWQPEHFDIPLFLRSYCMDR